MEFGRAIRYNINIKPTNNMGFIVKVGCANIVFENKDSLILAFSEFMNDPEETERKYNRSITIDEENSEDERELQSEERRR